MSSFATHSLSQGEVSRFSRQLILQGIGPTGQERIRNASVLIVGAGGLGCPVAIYLAAAGIGRIGIVDHDTVSLDNLHRQILHDEDRVGWHKVDSLKESVSRLNSQTTIDTYPVILSKENAFEIVLKYDIVADCSDNVATRYLVNDACVLSGKPLVSGSALGWEGQLTVYNNGAKCPCYRCIFPQPALPETVKNCSEAGVLGPVVGIIGSLQALEIIKIATGRESSFSGNLWLFDGFDGRTRTISLREKMTRCAVCGENPTVTELQDYELFCGSSATDKTPSLSLLSPEDRLSVRNYCSVRQETGNVPTLIDTRPPLEFETCHLPEALNIPLDEIKKLDATGLISRITQSTGRNVPETAYVVCHRGNDSQIAVKLLREKLNAIGYGIRFCDLIGGMDSWAVEVDSTFPRY
jgi:adenylyltransferase/sulfurtransferase